MQGRGGDCIPFRIRVRKAVGYRGRLRHRGRLLGQRRSGARRSHEVGRAASGMELGGRHPGIHGTHDLSRRRCPCPPVHDPGHGAHLRALPLLVQGCNRIRSPGIYRNGGGCRHRRQGHVRAWIRRGYQAWPRARRSRQRRLGDVPHVRSRDGIQGPIAERGGVLARAHPSLQPRLGDVHGRMFY